MKLLWRIAKEAKKYRSLISVAIVCTIALTLINLIAPRLLSQMVKIVSEKITEEGMRSILYLAAGLMALYGLKIVFRFASNYLVHVAAWNLVKELRIKLYAKLQTFSISYFHDKQTGDLMSRVIVDGDTFELLYAHILPETVTNIITLAGVTVIIMFINWKLALLTCIPIPFILFAGFYFSNKVYPSFRRRQKAKGELLAVLQDEFSGIQEIQAFCQQDRAVRQVGAKAEEETKYNLKALKQSSVFHPTVEFLTSLGTVIVVGFGGYIAYTGGIDVSEIVAFLLYLSLFYAPITSIAQLLENIQQSLAGAERVIEILDTPEKIIDRPDARPLENVKGEIEFKNVTFGYNEDVPVLKDVSFKIEPGKMLALVGPTGVGKTTLTQLISRFYDPGEGQVLIDGQDVKKATLASLHKNVAVVLQDTFLFNSTIEENIAFARPEASFDEIVAAAKTARIHDDITAMPDGYKTVVGERGTKLSGGQKQRIAIARAVLCSAPILILDEATASVDVETEAGIQKAIGELAGTRTVVAIAHRLSTVRNADLILVFEDGRIVQSGDHRTLSAAEGIYRRMCQVQEAGAKLSLDVLI